MWVTGWLVRWQACGSGGMKLCAVRVTVVGREPDGLSLALLSASPVCTACRPPAGRPSLPYPYPLSKPTGVRVELLVGLRQLLLQQGNLVAQLANLRLRRGAARRTRQHAQQCDLPFTLAQFAIQQAARKQWPLNSRRCRRAPLPNTAPQPTQHDCA